MKYLMHGFAIAALLLAAGCGNEATNPSRTGSTGTPHSANKPVTDMPGTGANPIDTGTNTTPGTSTNPANHAGTQNGAADRTTAPPGGAATAPGGATPPAIDHNTTNPTTPATTPENTPARPENNK